MLLPSEEIGTALHEAAHAIVLAAFGIQVHTISIIPTPKSTYAPGSLGHVCFSPFFQPQADDAWLESRWVEGRQMVHLAGYLIESLADENPRRPGLTLQPQSDLNCAISFMHLLSAPHPERALAHIATVEQRLLHLFSLPRYLEALLLISRALLEKGKLNSKEMHDLAFGGKCAVVHPLHPELRCTWRPDNSHSMHSHRNPDRSLVDFQVLRTQTLRPGPQPRIVTKLRALNLKGPGPAIPKSWDRVVWRLEQLPRAVYREYLQSPLGMGLEHIVDQLATGSPIGIGQGPGSIIAASTSVAEAPSTLGLARIPTRMVGSVR